MKGDKKTKIKAIIFIIIIICIVIMPFILNQISKNKGIRTINSSNIVDELKNHRTFGQYFQINANNYEVYDKFFTNSVYPYSDDTIVEYKQDYFIIRISGQEGYYMLVRVQTNASNISDFSHKNKETLQSLEQKQPVNLVGMISEVEANILEKATSVLENETNNLLQYCINVNM